jgi:hypothetical protein
MYSAGRPRNLATSAAFRRLGGTTATGQRKYRKPDRLMFAAPPVRVQISLE